MWASPVTLQGKTVSLAPLTPTHAPDLAEASADGDLHQLWYTTIPAPDAVEAEITRPLFLCESGIEAFAGPLPG